MKESKLDRFRKSVKAEWPELFLVDEPATCRQNLVDLVKQNIERLNAEFERHEENADAEVKQAIDRLGVDRSREVTFIRNYLMKCSNALERGFTGYEKRRAKDEEARMKDEGGMMKTEDGGRRTDGRRRRTENAWREVENLGWAFESLLESSELDSIVTDDEGSSAGVSDLDAVESATAGACGRGFPTHRPPTAACGGTSPTRGEENDTNEPKFDGTAIITEHHGSAIVTATSGVDFGLDKREFEAAEDSELKAGQIGNPKPVIGNPKSKIENSKSQVEGVLAKAFGKQERCRRRRELDRREVERQVEEMLKAPGQPSARKIIEDILKSSPVAPGILRPYRPWSP